ncbi:MAG: adenylyltransferase, partial [Candidatus Competibacteraceae bacterium]|nr:adenylyltransferase [Candidatus Competibacteraceae bacterium]
MTTLIEPHGGILKELYVTAEEFAVEKERAREYPSWDLSPRQFCDLEMLLCGAFSPLEGFLSKADYDTVVDEMRLSDDTLWPMPITLDVTEAFARELKPGDRVALRDPEGVMVAVLEVSDLWRPDLTLESFKVFGSDDIAHPGVYYLLHKTHPVYVGGRVKGIEAPVHYDFKHLRDTPRELRDKFRKWGWSRVVAFQTRNPMHRAHQELTFRAAQLAEANLLIHPVVGLTKPGDIDHFSRVRCYE